MKLARLSFPNDMLALPSHFQPEKVGEVWRVSYQELEGSARQWAQLHHIPPASADQLRIALIAIDVQNAFCIPGFELFVGGRSGTGAVDDNRRLCEFIYRNLARITQITATLDTHTAMQIFHPIFLVDEHDRHPAPHTQVTHADVIGGKWKFNRHLAHSLGFSPEYGQKHLEDYTNKLMERKKYNLTIWPYHVMLGSIGHALVSAFEEAVFFHTIARYSQADFDIKGSNPLTEHYSAIGPEVLQGAQGETIAQKSDKFLEKLRNFDLVIIAGQAKSHCVAWTISDLLSDIRSVDETLVNKVFLLEDCTSPVVVPGIADFTEPAEAAFQSFAKAGMHIVKSTDPLEQWPEIS